MWAVCQGRIGLPFSSGSQTLLFFSWQAADFRETLDPITCMLQGPKPKVSRSGKHPAFKWLVHSRSYWRCIFYQKENGKRGRYQMPLVISFLWLLLSQLYHANIQLPSVIQCISCRAQFHSLSNGLPGRDFFFNLYPDCTASDQTSYQSPLYRSAVFNWCGIVLLASSETQMSAWFCFPAFSLSPLCGKTQLPVRTLWFKRMSRYPLWTLSLSLSLENYHRRWIQLTVYPVHLFSR